MQPYTKPLPFLEEVMRILEAYGIAPDSSKHSNNDIYCYLWLVAAAATVVVVDVSTCLPQALNMSTLKVTHQDHKLCCLQIPHFNTYTLSAQSILINKPIIACSKIPERDGSHNNLNTQRKRDTCAQSLRYRINWGLKNFKYKTK